MVLQKGTAKIKTTSLGCWVKIEGIRVPRMLGAERGYIDKAMFRIIIAFFANFVATKHRLCSSQWK